jgi:N-methylhydantoinase B/oxoprolinase/acetone carboxylase alpha subunit
VVAVAPDGAERDLVSKGAFTARGGAEVWLRAPGSGGFGPPDQRDPDRLRDDVINGYVSTASAVRDYGVGDPAALACPYCPAPTGRALKGAGSMTSRRR